MAINICKEKTELLRKNAAILMARYAKAAPENEEFLRQLHGMEVLVSVSGHLKIWDFVVFLIFLLFYFNWFK